jgi:uncharacterized membrane protein YdfJ with MMPL/SSD domain
VSPYFPALAKRYDTRSRSYTAAITDQIRDHIADFDDFWRPIRSYFYWENLRGHGASVSAA